MSEWVSVKDKFPEKDAPVWYFFEHTGVSQGEFFGFYGCYEGYVSYLTVSLGRVALASPILVVTVGY